MKIKRTALLTALALLPSTGALAYPTDEAAQKETQIRRLHWQQQVDLGERRGRKTRAGAQWSSDRIVLKMTGAGRDFSLDADTPKNERLQRGLEAILDDWRYRTYNVALIDITDPSNPKFAAVNPTHQRTPGSVAKLLVGAAVFNELAQLYPNDIEARKAMLRNTMISADHWAMPNSHEVPHVNGDRVRISRVRDGDTFSLWEWIDHALSPSSNAAATMCWREAMAMHLLGRDYLGRRGDPQLWDEWDRDALTEAAYQVVRDPLVAANLDSERFYLRMFFTRRANRYIRAKSSRVSPLDIVQWMLAVEQGKMVDEWTSQELKKMLYLTRRRIRYAYGKSLRDSAVFFKSGSLYQCKPEEGYTCRKYRGNRTNILNSLAEIETPEGVTYIVAVMSNRLKRNAAYDHAILADKIHALVTEPYAALAVDASKAKEPER